MKSQLNIFSSIVFQLFSTKMIHIPFSAFLPDLLNVCACPTHLKWNTENFQWKPVFQYETWLSVENAFLYFSLLSLVPKVLRANSLLSVPVLCGREWFWADQLIAESEQWQKILYSHSTYLSALITLDGTQNCSFYFTLKFKLIPENSRF